MPKVSTSKSTAQRTDPIKAKSEKSTGSSKTQKVHDVEKTAPAIEIDDASPEDDKLADVFQAMAAANVTPADLLLEIVEQHSKDAEGETKKYQDDLFTPMRKGVPSKMEEILEAVATNGKPGRKVFKKWLRTDTGEGLIQSLEPGFGIGCIAYPDSCESGEEDDEETPL
ncbi:hypothetical protein D9611_005948 [Ephemerocybe angulata]|uniref:Uncharacterized protein n=1 Tax=Ephemerocybe angulata TaxID=980116 RepID=A0A8H5CG03_9AGAR|nr:hypothetical protein D9611_005948 [Tulosesus angulatus]